MRVAGIQGAAGSFVTEIVGCYQNVVGIPLARVCAELAVLCDEEAPAAVGGSDDA